MNEQAVVITSFGTSVPEVQISITLVEEALTAVAKDWTCVRVFTSPMIRRILRERGVDIPSLTEALERQQSSHCLILGGAKGIYSLRPAAAESMRQLAPQVVQRSPLRFLRPFLCQMEMRCRFQDRMLVSVNEAITVEQVCPFSGGDLP